MSARDNDSDETTEPAGAEPVDDRLVRADTLAHKAHAFMAEGKWEAGARELGRAAALALEAGDLAQHSRYLYTQALLLSRVPEQRPRAEELWRQAAAQAHVAGRRDLEVKALQRVVSLFIAAQDWEGAIAEMQPMVDVLEQDAEPGAELVGALRERGRLYQTRGLAEANRIFLERARDDLTRAADLARQIGDDRLALETRLELAALASVMPGGAGESRPEPLEALRREIEALGDKGLLGSMELEQAAACMRRGRHREALAHAEAARQAALSGPEPVRYLMACMIIAEARDSLGDRAGVIAILLTCKKSLEDLLGPAAGQPVRMVLDSLEMRWGRDGVARALEEYRARMKKA